MIIECSSCNSNYNVKDEKIPGSGAKIKCKKCENIIVIESQAPSIPLMSIEDLRENDQPEVKHAEQQSYDQTKVCPSCAENILIDAAKCKFCNHDFTNKSKNNRKNLAGVAFLILFGIFLGFFHVVVDAIPYANPFIPKEHFTYSMTFVQISEVVDRANSRTLGERFRGDDLLDHLLVKMKKRGMVANK